MKLEVGHHYFHVAAWRKIYREKKGFSYIKTLRALLLHHHQLLSYFHVKQREILWI